jgi:hypothetical protein
MFMYEEKPECVPEAVDGIDTAQMNRMFQFMKANPDYAAAITDVMRAAKDGGPVSEKTSWKTDTAPARKINSLLGLINSLFGAN